MAGARQTDRKHLRRGSRREGNLTGGSGDIANADSETRNLFSRLLEAWNKRNARDYALQFASDATLIGFDGTQVNGQLEIGAHLTEIFTHHQTPRYIVIVRDVRALAPDTTLLRANSGLI